MIQRRICYYYFFSISGKQIWCCIPCFLRLTVYFSVSVLYAIFGATTYNSDANVVVGRTFADMYNNECV